MERVLHSQHRDTPFSWLMLWRCSSVSVASCMNPSMHLDFLARMLVLVMFIKPAPVVTNLSGVHLCTSAGGGYICLAVLGPGCLWWDRAGWRFSWVGGCLDVWITPCWAEAVERVLDKEYEDCWCVQDSPRYDFWLNSVKSMLDLFGVVSIVLESLGCVTFNLNTLLVADYT